MWFEHISPSQRWHVIPIILQKSLYYNNGHYFLTKIITISEIEPSNSISQCQRKDSNPHSPKAPDLQSGAVPIPHRQHSVDTEIRTRENNLQSYCVTITPYSVIFNKRLEISFPMIIIQKRNSYFSTIIFKNLAQQGNAPRPMDSKSIILAFIRLGSKEDIGLEPIRVLPQSFSKASAYLQRNLPQRRWQDSNLRAIRPVIFRITCINQLAHISFLYLSNYSSLKVAKKGFEPSKNGVLGATPIPNSATWPKCRKNLLKKPTYYSGVILFTCNFKKRYYMHNVEILCIYYNQ